MPARVRHRGQRLGSSRQGRRRPAPQSAPERGHGPHPGPRVLAEPDEIFFSVVQKKVVSSNDFPSLEKLSETLIAFIARYNWTAEPFNWKYTADDLKDLLHRIREHEKQDTRRQTDLTEAA